MIHFISRYFYELHTYRQHFLNLAERRRFIRLSCLLLLCVTIIIFLWLR